MKGLNPIEKKDSSVRGQSLTETHEHVFQQ